MTDEQQLMYASDEDVSFYLESVRGLPTLAGLDGSGNGSDGIPLPYGLGPHSVRCLREIVEIVKPKRMLEIGFNMGYSSALWLELSKDTSVFSCDISYKQETIVAAEILSERYGLRFIYFNRNDETFRGQDEGWFDLIFIDGSHILKDVEVDIKLAIDLGIPYIAMDDWLPQFGDVQIAVNNFSSYLELVNVNGNIALYRNNFITL